MSKRNQSMNSEEYKEKLLDAGDSIMPHLFQKLIENGKFDIEKKCEINYIKSILQDSSLLRETLSEIKLSITIYKEFIDLAKHSVEINKKNSAIILLATTIEHQFNFFYGEILKSKDLEDKDITKIIKSNNFEEKLGWLMKFIINTEFPNELKKRILKITTLRNAIVHYKSAPGKLVESFKGSTYSFIKDEVDNIDFNDAFNLVEEIEEYTEKLLNENIESRKVALEIFINFRTKTPIKLIDV